MQYSIGHNYFVIKVRQQVVHSLVLLLSLSLCINVNAVAPTDSSHLIQKYHNVPSGVENLLKMDVFYYRDFPYRQRYAHQEIKGCIKMPARGIIRCKEFISLVRSENQVNNWLKNQHKKGYLPLTMKAFGITGTVGHISKITPAGFSSVNKKMADVNSPYIPATGIFIRHIPDVRQYTFKNIKTNVIFSVKATPKHPVYSVNKQNFIPVSQLSTEDQLLSENGQKIQLLCQQGIKKGCGVPFNQGGITSVYNIETNHRHTYFVQDGRLLVHNCNGGMGKAEEKINASSNGQTTILKGTSVFSVSGSGKEKQVRLIGLVGGMGGEPVSDVIMSEPYTLEYVQELKRSNAGRFLSLSCNDKQAEVLGVMDDSSSLFCGYSQLERLSWQNGRLARKSLFRNKSTLVQSRFKDIDYMDEFHAQYTSWPIKWPWQEGGSWADCAVFSFFGGVGTIILTGGIASVVVVSQKDNRK